MLSIFIDFASIGGFVVLSLYLVASFLYFIRHSAPTLASDPDPDPDPDLDTAPDGSDVLDVLTVGGQLHVYTGNSLFNVETGVEYVTVDFAKGKSCNSCDLLSHCSLGITREMHCMSPTRADGREIVWQLAPDCGDCSRV